MKESYLIKKNVLVIRKEKGTNIYVGKKYVFRSERRKKENEQKKITQDDSFSISKVVVLKGGSLFK